MTVNDGYGLAATVLVGRENAWDFFGLVLADERMFDMMGSFVHFPVFVLNSLQVLIAGSHSPPGFVRVNTVSVVG